MVRSCFVVLGFLFKTNYLLSALRLMRVGQSEAIIKCRCSKFPSILNYLQELRSASVYTDTSVSL